ncbi:LuxR C-terminal-related transcriptional regulator [Botrimarina sp.]|uniref:response regulator transcription factor n=1 Tax=Botrimarina sp. TaxID=2795802 RepID=UPI0032ECC9C7
MSIARTHRAQISVLVGLRHQLDSEAFAARISREAGYTAEAASDTMHSGAPEMHVAVYDVRLLDRCGGYHAEMFGANTLVLVDPTDPRQSTAGCACCRKFSRSSAWPRLLDTLASVAGRTPGCVVSHDGALKSLTRREIDVLRLVGLGKTVNQCAEELGVARSTIGNHKYRLMRKLGVSTSLELLRIAVRNGLVDFE